MLRFLLPTLALLALCHGTPVTPNNLTEVQPEVTPLAEPEGFHPNVTALNSLVDEIITSVGQIRVLPFNNISIGELSNARRQLCVLTVSLLLFSFLLFFYLIQSFLSSSLVSTKTEQLLPVSGKNRERANGQL